MELLYINFVFSKKPDLRNLPGYVQVGRPRLRWPVRSDASDASGASDAGVGAADAQWSHRGRWRVAEGRARTRCEARGSAAAPAAGHIHRHCPAALRGRTRAPGVAGLRASLRKRPSTDARELWRGKGMFFPAYFASLLCSEQ